MDDSILIEQNPWWKDRELINSDKHLADLANRNIRWDPGLWKHFNWDRDHLYTIRGPRQVGKTTMIKRTIRRLIVEKGIDPFNILFFSTDLIDSREQFLDILKTYESIHNRYSSKGHRFVFIDEITNIPQWEKVIKFQSDRGDLTDTTVVLTGSHTLDIGRSVERLPGRRGEGEGEVLDKIMVPMKFREYLKTIDKKLFDELSSLTGIDRTRRKEIIRDQFKVKELPGEITRTELFQDDLDRRFNDYIITGGFPRPISSFKGDGRINDDIYGIYTRSLMGDLTRNGLSDTIAKQVLRSIIERMTTRISNNSIAKENEIGSHNTISKYVEALERSFTLNGFYQIDRSKGRIKARSEKKIYLSDPFIYHAMRGWSGGLTNLFGSAVEHISDPQTLGKMVEMVVSNHMIRLAYSMNPTDLFSHHEKVLFWRKKGSEREVDFIVVDNENLLPVEVKYTQNIRGKDLSGIRSFGKGIILTKRTLETKGNYTFIPAPVFLLLV
ncbi:MAG: ATP-binding protein [Thermoplasmatota archaeon]